jgi:metal-responsive CopG/Arc/MetJ family transcriptional regulator
MSEKRYYVDLGKELAAEIDAIGKELHFTSRRNVIAVLKREFVEVRK